MDSLPFDITTDILLRVPITCMGFCKCVCKTWHKVISNPNFSFTHLNKSSKTSQDFIILDENQIYYVENNTDESHNNPFVRIPKMIQMGSDFDPSVLIVMGSCNGLLCIGDTEFYPFTLPHNPIRIFNPLMREMHLLPHFNPSKSVRECVCGFGFDVESNEFKVVLVMFYRENQKIDDDVKNEVQVHTLGSNDWRTIGHAPNVFDCVFQSVSFVFVNGALHWISMESIELNSLAKLCIVSFHVGIEEFGFVPVPDSFVVPNPQFNTAMIYCGLAELGGCLSVANGSSEESIDIWIMKNYGMEESWVKQFSIQQNLLGRWSFESVLPLYIQKEGEVLLLWNSKGLFSYNSERNECTPLELVGIGGEQNHSFEVFPIIGSLIRATVW